MIISHNSERYKSKIHRNGAYWYSYEIVNRIIPEIKTDRNWVTINTGECVDHSIVFIHNNLDASLYDYLRPYKDLILVCGIPQTMKKVCHLGRPIYIPLSVDVGYVEQFKKETKTNEYAYVGRMNKRLRYAFPQGTDYLENMERDELLTKVADYKYVFAVGRCAIESMILGCEVVAYDVRFRDTDLWKIRDNLDVVPLLQNQLDMIDGRGKR